MKYPILEDRIGQAAKPGSRHQNKGRGQLTIELERLPDVIVSPVASLEDLLLDKPAMDMLATSAQP